MKAQWRIRVPGVRKKIGLGDAIERATSAVGLRPCRPCKKRAQWLNDRIALEPRREKS